MIPSNLPIILVSPIELNDDNPLRPAGIQQDINNLNPENGSLIIYAFLATPKAQISFPPGSTVIINTGTVDGANNSTSGFWIRRQENASPGNNQLTLRNLMSIGRLLFSLLAHNRIFAELTSV